MRKCHLASIRLGRPAGLTSAEWYGAKVVTCKEIMVFSAQNGGRPALSPMPPLLSSDF